MKTLKELFQDYLREAPKARGAGNYEESTIKDYSELRIQKLCDMEELTWVELLVNIDRLLKVYDTKTGCRAEDGKKGDGSFINAMRRFKEFKDNLK